MNLIELRIFQMCRLGTCPALTQAYLSELQIELEGLGFDYQILN